MKKIMFNDKFGLTESVLTGRKTMTRRMISDKLLVDAMAFSSNGKPMIEYLITKAPYKVGEIVAVAQSYHTLNKSGFVAPEWCEHTCEDSAGYENKMFVRADLMPYRIRIIDIKLEYLQDISDDDCMREGIMEGEFMNTWDRYYYDTWGDVPNHVTFKTPREAFASLIDKVSGKGTWENNPFVLAYDYKLIM